MANGKMNPPGISPFRHSTFLFLAVALITGALIGYADISVYWSAIPFIIAIALYIFIAHKSSDPLLLIRYSRLNIVWMMLLCTGFGMISMFISKPPEYDFENETFPPYAFGRVNRITYTNYGERLVTEVRGFTDLHSQEIHTPPFKIILETDATSLNIGDEICFINAIKPIKPNHNYFNPSPQNYNREILYTAHLESQYIKKFGHSSDILSFASNIRDQLIVKIEKSELSADARNFFITSLLGDASYIDNETRQTFSNAGIAHILAISGLHIGIIAFVLGTILLPLNLFLNHKIRFIMIILLLWLFVFISGLNASVVRACIMATFYYGAIILERKNNSFNALCAAAFFITAISPMSIFDIGMQLSFTSVAGILLLSDKFNGISRKKHPVAYKMVSLVEITLIATLFSWMLTAYYFNSFPLWFLPVNLIIIPLLPAYMALGLLYIFLLCAGYDSSVIACILDSGYHNLLELISYFVGADNHDSCRIYVSPTTVATYYAMLAGISTLIYYRNNRSILITIVLVIVFVTSCISFPAKQPGNCYIIQNNPNGTFIRIYTDSKDTLIEAGKNTCEEITIHGSGIIVSINDNSIFRTWRYDSIRKCDLMVIGNGAKSDLDILLKYYAPEKIVVMNSMREEQETEYIYQATKHNIPTHSIRKDGPLLVNTPIKREI